MVTILRQLFVNSPQPSHDDKESAVEMLIGILEQAKALGHAHVSDELERSSWGGDFLDSLSSAWQIVNMFVQRISDWFVAQDGDVSEEDVLAQVDGLAETVSATEVAAAIEEQILNLLAANGVAMVEAVAQPGACAFCLSMAAIPQPIGDFLAPPYHPNCRCTTAPADEGE